MGTTVHEEGVRHWREDDLVACEDGANLPDRCTACNAPTHRWYRRLRARLARSEEEQILFGLQVVRAVLMPHRWLTVAWGAERGPVTEITHGLCPLHRRRVLVAGLVAIVGALLLVVELTRAALHVATVVPTLIVGAVGVAALLAGVTLRLRNLPRVVDRRGMLRLRVGAPFLESIPPRPDGGGVRSSSGGMR